MSVVITVVLNRAGIPYDEFFRINQGSSIRGIIEQPDQLTYMTTTVGKQHNAQNVYDMDPEEIHYQVAGAIMAGNMLVSVRNSLFHFNPYRPTCPDNFPPGGVGTFCNRIYQYCFHAPTEGYQLT